MTVDIMLSDSQLLMYLIWSAFTVQWPVFSSYNVEVEMGQFVNGIVAKGTMLQELMGQ